MKIGCEGASQCRPVPPAGKPADLILDPFSGAHALVAIRVLVAHRLGDVVSKIEELLVGLVSGDHELQAMRLVAKQRQDCLLYTSPSPRD